MSDLHIRPISSGDKDSWYPLFQEYREFCGRAHEPEVLERTWEWLMSEKHEVWGLVAEKNHRVAAVAHYRHFLRTVDANKGIHLDDLYVAQEARGNGTARALLEHIGQIAHTEGVAFVRWVTADDNSGARRLYKQVASETSWITFELDPS